MYRNQSFDERMQGSVSSNEGFDYHTEINRNRYFMKWSPQEDMKFYSKSRYGSPRMLSKSVPRKNKNLARCRINRSLNFDSGVTKTDLKFKSPNTSLDSICCDDEKQLSRSAKIMKALNFGGSPINIGSKVNKTLNFDFSPSPKRLLHYNGSPCNIVHLNMSTSSPKIGKSLNFDSSPAESHISSILGTSIDSIDENQNQTPAQRRRSVKKSLKYLTPHKKTNNPLFDFADKSPMLRTELRDKIDSIIKTSTSKMHSLKKSLKKPPFVKEVFVSTPRNLFNDFEDESAPGPRTPRNRVQLIPIESIKKSHKKERFPRRFESDDQLAEKLNEQRPLTPPLDERARTSRFDVNSIKRSHKKDKSLKSPFNRLEDDSLDGSIFNYKDDDNQDVDNTPAKLNYDSDSDLPKNSKRNSVKSRKVPENRNSSPSEPRPSTPINRVDFLDIVMGSSIKKSHKKMKDENRRRIHRQRILDQEDEEQSEPHASNSNAERSTTPENTNSSRLLLPNFSSVKKSHKKDKRSKILSNFARRQKIFSYDCDKLSNTFDSSLANEDSWNLDKPSKSPSPQKRKLSTASDLDDEFRPLSMNDSESVEYVTASEEFKIFTPIKRKKAAPHRKFTDNELEQQNFDDLPLTRCETPILDQSQEIENFVTPEKIEIEPRGKSTPKKVTPRRRTRSRGKLTPETKITSERKVTPKNNKSALELIANINSVKKSHKKEKKGNRFSFRDEQLNSEAKSPMKEMETDLLNVSSFLTPESSFNNNPSETSFKNISQMALKFLESYEDNSKPSTSYDCQLSSGVEKIVGKKSKSVVTTPPNSLKAKQYLISQQSESIKKSHKKKREELRHSMIVQDLELSDDGSIFMKEDRLDDFSADCAINERNPDEDSNNRGRVSIILNMNESIFSGKARKHRRSSRLIRNMSNDGSLFGSDKEGK